MEKQELLQKYVEYVSKEGKKPSTVSKFTFALGIKETDFYKCFANLNQLEQFYWQNVHTSIIEKIKSQEVYQNYSVREKLLSYAFTLVETLKENRSFVLIVLRKNCDALNKYQKEVKNYAEDLIAEGTQKNEIQDRILVSTYYSDIITKETSAIIHFWVKDDSENFEKTDVFIEKSINFVMDILGRNWIDTGFDFVKYWFQKK
jgi:hypothetical protein